MDFRLIQVLILAIGATSIPKTLENSGNLRTLGSLKASLRPFRNFESVLAKSKMTGNVIHEQIISGSDGTLILDIIPPPELHLVLGVNHLFKTPQSIWSDAEMWPSFLNIKQSPHHRGQFEGNKCRKLLKNVDLLQQLAKSRSAFQVFGIIDLLRKFDSVLKICFGSVLEADYYEKIDQFKASYLALPNVSVTPKIHAVFHHLKDFIDRQISPLGLYSEQA